MLIRTGNKITVHAPHVIKAGELYDLIENSANLHADSFDFQIIGGRKVYGHIVACWRPRSDKCIYIAERQAIKTKRIRWIDPETQIRIVGSTCA